ncbi:acylphosphatase [Paenibacillus dakarensis]|uniref:acylphosphatase n=1 Tax=Paenibacillus dakarensis TaxID=1527293 RepID=UPI0006D52B3A|nr:acylphosphatase [Paenibacillus dakarensis]
MGLLKKLRNSYVEWHANRTKLPSVKSSSVVRKKVTFTGKVQRVGFRYETYCIAQKIGLTGWVRNLEDGSVDAEIQGEELKIDYLIHCMKSLKRASVKNVTIIDLPVLEGEEEFAILE